MYKIYTNCLTSVLYDHCHHHKTIPSEQAAGKRGMEIHKTAVDQYITYVRSENQEKKLHNNMAEL